MENYNIKSRSDTIIESRGNWIGEEFELSALRCPQKKPTGLPCLISLSKAISSVKGIYHNDINISICVTCKETLGRVLKHKIYRAGD